MKTIMKLAAVFLLLASSVAHAQATISAVTYSSAQALQATVTWTTNIAASSQVIYGASPSALTNGTPVNYAAVTSHSMAITVSGSTNYYAVISVDASGNRTQSSTFGLTTCGNASIPITATATPAYQFGTYTLTYVAPSGAGSAPTICGVAAPTSVTGSLTASGSFGATVALVGTWTVAMTDAGNVGPVSISGTVLAQSNDYSLQIQADVLSSGSVVVIATRNGSSVWPPISGGGGSGTVTNFTAGTLSPLFTTSVATSTTTPALSFALTNAAANTVLGNPTGSATGPVYTTNPVVTSITTGNASSPTNGALNMVSVGTLPAAAATNTVQVTVPNSVTAYTLELPGVQPSAANLYATCTNANPSVCTFAAPFVLTTTGSSGAATYTGGTLNIPQYSGGGGGGTVIAFPLAARVGLSSTSIIPPFNAAAVDSAANENRIQFPSPLAGTAKNLYLYASQIDNAQPASGSLVCTLRKNATNTALTVTVAASGTVTTPVSDTTHTVSIVAGDLLTMGCVNNATAASFTITALSMVIQ